MHEKATHWTGAAMAELKEAIHSFIDDANGNPQPLMGTKDPGQHHRCRQTRAPTVRFDPLGLVVNYVGAFVYQLLGTQNLQRNPAVAQFFHEVDLRQIPTSSRHYSLGHARYR
jgi:hypothetical protein